MWLKRLTAAVEDSGSTDATPTKKTCVTLQTRLVIEGAALELLVRMFGTIPHVFPIVDWNLFVMMTVETFHVCSLSLVFLIGQQSLSRSDYFCQPFFRPFRSKTLGQSTYASAESVVIAIT